MLSRNGFNVVSWKVSPGSLFLLSSGHPETLDGATYVKPIIFRKVKEIKHLSERGALYAAQTNVQIDAEIVKKGGFRVGNV